MSNVTIISDSHRQAVKTVESLSHGDCFTTVDYDGKNIYMKVDVGYLGNSSIIKDKAEAGLVPVLSVASGRLRFIKEVSPVSPFKEVQIKPIR